MGSASVLAAQEKWLVSSAFLPSSLVIRSALKTSGFPQGGHPLLGQVVVLRAKDDALLSGVGEQEHQACRLTLIQLEVFLKRKNNIILLLQILV